MTLSPDEANAALASIQRSQAAGRRAFRAHAGHLHLWLWGVIWIIMAMTAQFGGSAGVQVLPLLSFTGGVISILIGHFQRRQVRLPVDQRFIRVLMAVLLFGLLVPFVLRPVPTPEMVFTYIGLLVALAYVVAGLWFDLYLFALGLLLAGLLLAGLWLALPIFWWWIAGAGGGTLIGAGFYVRYRWEPA